MRQIQVWNLESIHTYFRFGCFCLLWCVWYNKFLSVLFVLLNYYFCKFECVQYTVVHNTIHTITHIQHVTFIQHTTDALKHDCSSYFVTRNQMWKEIKMENKPYNLLFHDYMRPFITISKSNFQLKFKLKAAFAIRMLDTSHRFGSIEVVLTFDLTWYPLLFQAFWTWQEQMLASHH